MAQQPKVFNDPIHGHIEMEPLLVKIIDTPEFQRLRFIKQLGGVCYVYPGASHHRFEHSIGVAHLAGQLIKNLMSLQPDLGITDTDVLCIQIAGLCHDLGHGPFSHLFDEFLKEVDNKSKWKHERMSYKVFEHLIERHNIKRELTRKGITKRDFKFIEELIAGPEEPNEEGRWTYKGREKEKAFLYQIVANADTGIDVDKMDYFARDYYHIGMKSNFSHERYMMFARVCEGEICMRDKEARNMYELFHTRNYLFSNVCHHKVKQAIDVMIRDALIAADEYRIQGSQGRQFRLSEAVNDMEAFLQLTDTILDKIMSSTSNREGITKAKAIIQKIHKRDLYRYVGGKIFQSDWTLNIPQLKSHMRQVVEETLGNNVQQNLQEHDPPIHTNPQISANDFKFEIINHSYGKKEKDPIKKLGFYTKKDVDKKIHLNADEVSFLLPKQFSETKVMIFFTRNEENIVDRARAVVEKFFQSLQ